MFARKSRRICLFHFTVKGRSFLNFLFSFLFLGIASIEDYYTELINPWIWRAMLWVSFLLGVFEQNILARAEFALIAFLFGCLLLYFEFWGGGDLKVFTGLAALNPSFLLLGITFFGAIFLFSIFMRIKEHNRFEYRDKIFFIPFIFAAYIIAKFLVI